jgi:hypothetical protein
MPYPVQKYECDASIPSPKDAATVLDRLALLPREITDAILCEKLNFNELGTIRRLNIRGKHLVDTLPAYRTTTTIASSTLRVLSATGLLKRYSAAQFYNLLCHDRCASCNAFGSFLSLATATRSCYNCAYFDRISEGVMTTIICVLGTTPLQLAITKALIGDDIIQRKRDILWFNLVRPDEARHFGFLLHGSEEEKKDLTSRRHSRFMEWNQLKLFFTPLPYLDLQQQRIEHGLYCRGCEYNWHIVDEGYVPGPQVNRELYRLYNYIYSEAEVLRHVQICQSAKMLWSDHISDRTAIKPKDRIALIRSRIEETQARRLTEGNFMGYTQIFRRRDWEI